MTTTRRWICEIALRLALIVSVFYFALYAQDLDDAGFCALAAFWAYALFRVLFSFCWSDPLKCHFSARPSRSARRGAVRDARGAACSACSDAPGGA